MRKLILLAALALPLGACASFDAKFTKFSATVQKDAALLNSDIAAVSADLPQMCAIVQMAIADYELTLTGKGSGNVAAAIAGVNAGCAAPAPQNAQQLATGLIKVYRAVKAASK
ncbi:hypothetical protein SAMN05519103_00366 [Rhizobiales bacterium GAS113]|nr:hypothetical protein SAMN05519103_00366 [Rhizobiales bacterium GAS113]